MAYPLRSLLIITLVGILFALMGCGAEQDTPEQDAPEQGASGQGPGGENNPVPEPAEATPSEEEPAGEVVEVSNEPEGIVADPETGLLAVGFREPDRLALIDSSSGETIQDVELPSSPRHLQLAAPGGPVLVPSESAATLVQVGLPEGDILAETPVGTNPHDAAAAPDGRIFVANEGADTVSVIEDDSEIETLEAPIQPGGVAVTDDGLVGVIGVRGLELEVYEADTLESLGRVEAGEGPTHIVAGPDGRFYVMDTTGEAILIYEASPEPEQVDSVPLPGSPYGIAIDPERGHLWVTLTADNQLVQFALEGGELRELARYPTVQQPNTVAVDTASGRVYVTGREGDQLQILDPNEES